MATKKPKGLGRGLEALLGPTVGAAAADADAPATNPGLPASLLLADMVPGMYQPRTRMDEGALYELAESIKAQGIMQPILVRRLSRRRQRRQVRNHRRRAPLPRRQARRPGQRAGAGARRAQRSRRRDGADREHPARGPQSAGRGAGPAAPDPRLRAHARTGRAGGGPLAQCRQQPAAPAEPGRSGADHADGGRPGHGPRPRAARAGARRADHGGQPDHGQEDVGARGRVAGQEDRRRIQPHLAQAQEGEVARPAPAWKRNCRTCSPPRSRCA